MQHRAIDITIGPAHRRPGRASLAERDWLLRAHDLRGVASCLALVAHELRAARSARLTVLGDRVMRSCDRLMQLAASHDGEDRVAATLPALLADVADLARALAGPRTRVDVAGPDVPLRRSAERAVFRILFNLASNAVTAANARGGGVVRIAATLSAREAVFLISNDGTGLFEPDVPSARGRAGSGLGLVIAEALARELGGSLRLRRGRPGTTTLGLVLPLSVFTEDA